MDPHNTWSYLASLPTDGSLTLSTMSSPSTIADERSPENQAAGLQYLHFPQDLRIGINELIMAHNQHVRETALLSMQVRNQSQLLWSIFNLLRNQTHASTISDTHQDSSSEVQQQSSPSSHSDGSFHTPRSQPEPDHVSPSREQESGPSVTERRQGQVGRTESMRARRRPTGQQRSTTDWRRLPQLTRCRYTICGIQRELSAPCMTSRMDIISLTTRLFFTIASPCAMEQVREFLAAMRGQDNCLAFRRSATLKEAFLSLDKFAKSRRLAQIQTRYTLVGIVDLYTSRRNATVSRGNWRTYIDEKILSDIISEEYPSLGRDSPIFRKHVRRFKDTLYSGRNWYMCAKEFGRHILSFIPSGGEFAIYEGMIQRIPPECFKVLLDVLKGKRGHFLRECGRRMRGTVDSFSSLTPPSELPLETTDLEVVKGMEFDSDELLDLFTPR